jgi:hypothetical protein
VVVGLVLGLAVAGVVLRPALFPDPAMTPSPSPAAAVVPTSPPSDPSVSPALTPAWTVDPELAWTSPNPKASLQAIPALPVPDGRVATRVTVAGLGIDLPVTRQTTAYPACGVAMYLTDLLQPGQGGVTYLYAHAQAGNFLPILRESLVNDGARMLGMAVDIYTGDNLRFSYRIVEVRRHVTSLDGAFAWRGESSFLQTSEGIGPTSPKLQVVAEHLSTVPAADDEAHPAPKPVTCR